MSKAGMAASLLAAGVALALTACGGGGGNTRADAPPPTPPPSAPPPSPPPTPPPPTPPPTTPQPAIDAHLALTNARNTGYTGAGYRIGVVDSGVNRNHPTLAGRVLANYNYVDPRTNNTSVDDAVGHGTTVAQLAAGAATGQWPGGIAPGARILSARIIADKAPEDDGSGDGNEVDGALGLASIHRDLINAGMRIMNNSWGGLYWTNPAATAAIAGEYRPFITNHDGLVVFATGNESKSTPSDMAALPSQPGPNGTRPAADLERGWLAVAALDTANPTQLASYSNACGEARNYCLVAPGTSIFIHADSTPDDLKYYYGSGTSYAAPLVSGAAALVWEAFPWFDNDLVRQTLLGTATDLGEPGVDAVFGHGLLNVGKAVKGPGRLDWGDITADVPVLADKPVWGNDISGAGGIIKRGAGGLVLTGDNTYLGRTRVEEGGLVLQGQGALASGVDIAATSSAVLQFHQGGRVRGDVANAGVVALLDAGAPGRIDGNYVQSAGGMFLTLLGAQPLQVGGTATLNGGQVYVGGVVDGYVTRQTQRLIDAQGGLSGQFGSLGWGQQFSLLEATFAYDANSAWLELARVEVNAAAAAIGLGGSALASASRLESAFGVLDGIPPGSLAGLGGGFTAAAAQLQRVAPTALGATLESLSGQSHAAASAMTFDSLDMGRRALSAELETRLQERPQASSWMRQLGGGGRGSYAGSGFQLDGWMMGRDASWGSNGALGFAFGETRARHSPQALLDRGRDRQTQAQLYAGWNMGSGYVLGQAGAGAFTRDIDRQLLLGSEATGVHADYNGSFRTAAVEAGYRLGSGTMELTPYLGASYARVEGGGFSEEGGHGFGLRADAWSSSRSQALAGVRGRYQGRNWSVGGYAEWQQTLASDGLELAASFVGVDAWTPLQGLQPQRSGGLAGFSIDTWLSRNSRLGLGYDQRFGPRGNDALASLRYWYGF